MKLRTVILSGCLEEINVLQDQISTSLTDRPKKLLVIINPNSGKRRALKVYRKYAVPLFEDCGIQADVWVTSKPKEPTEILKGYDLSQIDGIVAVGGDGIYCECINGLVHRVQRDNNVDQNNHKNDIIPASLPIGIIPAGSGDVIAQYLHGTRCPRTAVLHILLGGQVPANLVSLHEGGKLLSYSALVLGFGLFGDMMHDCEKFRWMGPTRYDVIPLANMFKRREFDVEVEYYQSKDSPPKRGRLYGRQISLPNGFIESSALSRKQRAKSTSDLKEAELKESVKEKGRVYAVDSHAITMKEKAGQMTPHFGQDSLKVYTTYKCSLTDHISQLTKVKNRKTDCYDFKFVRQHSVSGYSVNLESATTTNMDGRRILQKDFYVNCDGEAIRLSEPRFDVKFHNKVVRFFGDVIE